MCAGRNAGTQWYRRSRRRRGNRQADALVRRGLGHRAPLRGPGHEASRPRGSGQRKPLRLPRSLTSSPKRKAGTRAGLSKPAIVVAAAKLIESVGANGFSLRKLAKALGVGPTTIHFHFEGGVAEPSFELSGFPAGPALATARLANGRATRAVHHPIQRESRKQNICLWTGSSYRACPQPTRSRNRATPPPPPVIVQFSWSPDQLRPRPWPTSLRGVVTLPCREREVYAGQRLLGDRAKDGPAIRQGKRRARPSV